MKIGIYGGAFNPVHNGHINLCKQCQEIYGFDKIIFIPTYISPHKENNQDISFQDRLNMLNIAIENEISFEASDIESKLGGISYTYNTILKLDKPKDELYLIVGSDMFEIFHKWYEYKKLLQLVTLVVGARNINEYEKLIRIKSENYSNTSKIEIAKIHTYEISSTEIRTAISNNISANEHINRDVLSYIKANDLYRGWLLYEW